MQKYEKNVTFLISISNYLEKSQIMLIFAAEIINMNQKHHIVMKKTLTILMFCLAAHVEWGWAQNTESSIRQRYTAIKEYINSHNGTNDNDGSEFLECYHVEARLFLPASGGHKENVYMYFDEKEEEKVYPSHILNFVTTKYNYAVRDYYEEYLYDADGNIAFIYAMHPWLSFKDGDEDMDYEFRFYFNKGKLLKTIVKKSAIGQNAFVEEYSGTTVKNIHQDFYQSFIARSKEFMNLFNTVEQTMYNYSE